MNTDEMGEADAGAPFSPPATAYHEAGHAVAAWRLGFKFRYVTIKVSEDEDGCSLGHVAFYRRSDSTANHTKRVIEIFAGQCAEAIYHGRPPVFGMGSDNQTAVNLAVELYKSQETREAFLHYCFLAARDLVDFNVKQIKAVASALLKSETLSYQDVIEVIMPGSRALAMSLRAKARAK